ncbi:myrosinase-binding protein 2 [Raphanus sativus]|uniref:Myrosinase-binding protein 2 n=1 Tax=Raphanus sativus TaxID=3726 RepID=A0A6J0P0X9_RAPSA|nr:myrosinase-binding protein 2 [Raphanus sativus]
MSWDDGKHTKVKNVQLTFDDVIRSIEVEYVGTNLKSQRRGTVGTRSDGFTLSTDEYITNVSGYYKTTFSGDLITALTFKTNKKTYGPYGNKTQNYFSADAPSGSQIAGFLGTSGNALSSLDVHFAPIKPQPGGPGTGGGGNGSNPVDPPGAGGGGTGAGGGPGTGGGGTGTGGGSGTGAGGGGPGTGGSGTETGTGSSGTGTGAGGSGTGTGSGQDSSEPDGSGKIGPLGGDKGNVFDDVGFEGVKKITVGADQYSVTYIKIEYIKDGKVVVREHGTVRGELKEFSVDYPNDNITAVGGTFKHVYTYDTTLITSLYFTTSKGFTSPLFGIESEKKGTEFEFKGKNGGKLLGFHGRGGNAIDAIGAYFDTGSRGGSPQTDVPGKKGPLGGEKGEEFNDVGFQGVKKITVGADEYSVTYIKIEYVKDGKVETREHGTSRGELKEFSVNYPNDSITAVSGTYKHIFTYDTTLITSLYFTTSKGFTSPLFGIDSEKKGTEFEFKGENGGKLIGFHGRGGNAIDAIGAYFDTGSRDGDAGKPSTNDPKPKPVDVPGKKGPLGGDKGNVFDDVGFEGVKKVTVGADDYSITYIKIEYLKDGKVEILEHGTARGKLEEFSVDYPNDSITEVGGSYKHVYNYDTTLITSLYFTTSKGYTSPFFGKKYDTATEFEFKGENGGKLIGFHGRGGNAIDAIGAYFDTGSKPGGPDGSGSGSSNGSSPQKLDAQGGKGGNQWDDSGDHDGVTKIVVASSRVIEQIRFDYVKKGQTKEGPAHGVKGARSSIKTFEISHPDEYLLSVKGWSNSSNKIVGIEFITNTRTSEYYGFEKLPGEEGTDILLEVKDKKIVGFHGFADTHLNSLGAYFAPIASTPLKPSKKLTAVGGDEGASWDDGAFDGVKKIQVGQNNDGVSFVAVEYENGSQKVVGDGHGKQSALGVETFELTDGEYITSVGVYYDKIHAEGRGVTVVTSLVFKTNKLVSQPFGMTGGEYVELKEEGNKIVGFHGKASDWVHQIGVYVAPVTK